MDFPSLIVSSTFRSASWPTRAMCGFLSSTTKSAESATLARQPFGFQLEDETGGEGVAEAA